MRFLEKKSFTRKKKTRGEPKLTTPNKNFRLPKKSLGTLFEKESNTVENDCNKRRVKSFGKCTLIALMKMFLLWVSACKLL